MSEEVLFESESRMNRDEIGAYLRRLAEALEGGEDITLSAGEESITLVPPARPTFEIKAEREGPDGGPYERSIEFELEWADREEGADDGLEIE